MHTPDREAKLRRQLERVRRRLADDVPHSPDWDAAMAELEEVEAAMESPADGQSPWPAKGLLSPSTDP